MTFRSVKISPQVNEKQRCRHFYGTFSDRPNGITKGTDATVADRGVCRARGASSLLDRTPCAANDNVASATWRPFYVRELAPRRGRDVARRAKSQLLTTSILKIPFFEDDQAILTVSSSFKPILEDE